MILEKEYFEGLDMDGFEHLKNISSYNFNYFIGFKNNLLYGISDDDNTTEWFLIYTTINNIEIIYLGESYCSQGNKLNRYEQRCT